MIWIREGPKREITFDPGRFNVPADFLNRTYVSRSAIRNLKLPVFIAGILVADELRSALEPLETLQGGPSVRVRVRPPVNSIVVAVTHESAPERSDRIIAEADVVAGDRPSGKAAQENLLEIAPVV
jgi:hypothetical protein